MRWMYKILRCCPLRKTAEVGINRNVEMSPVQVGTIANSHKNNDVIPDQIKKKKISNSEPNIWDQEQENNLAHYYTLLHDYYLREAGCLNRENKEFEQNLQGLFEDMRSDAEGYAKGRILANYEMTEKDKFKQYTTRLKDLFNRYKIKFPDKVLIRPAMHNLESKILELREELGYGRLLLKFI